jgi:hypothetical protein
MRGTDMSFEDLLSRMPMGPEQNEIIIVGGVFRSPDQGKFILMTQEGRNVTLDVGAVKSHEVLAGSIGQTLVRLTLDAAKVPSDLSGQLTQWPPAVTGTPVAADILGTAYNQDRKVPFYDKVRLDPIGTLAEVGGGTIAEGVGGFGGIDPTTGQVLPFALATPHHAPAATIAALQAMASQALLRTGLDYDKPPVQDGTYPTPHGVHSDF